MQSPRSRRVADRHAESVLSLANIQQRYPVSVDLRCCCPGSVYLAKDQRFWPVAQLIWKTAQHIWPMWDDRPRSGSGGLNRTVGWVAGGGLRLVAEGVAGVGVGGFEVSFADSELGVVRTPLSEVAGVAFERVAPVRSIPSYRGQRNNPGFYWSASVGAHVEFESWLERDEAMALDFDPDTIRYAAQPFWLLWTEGSQRRSHAPDFFARRADGGGVVIDCRPADRIKPRDAVAFAATLRACGELGWTYRLVSGHDPIWLGNLRWLAGYRHPRYRVGPVAAALREAFAEPRPLIEGAQSVGDPIAVLPVFYHLVWCGELAVDLALRLEGWSIVTGASR